MTRDHSLQKVSCEHQGGNKHFLTGFRPLHVAAQKGAVNIVQRLYAAKANLKTQTRAGELSL